MVLIEEWHVRVEGPATLTDTQVAVVRGLVRELLASIRAEVEDEVGGIRLQITQ